jgi:hypothetical protein
VRTKPFRPPSRGSKSRVRWARAMASAVRAWTTPLVCCLMSSAALACEPVSRVRECRQFSSLVNGAYDEIEAAAKPADASAYRRAAARYQRLVTELQRADGQEPPPPSSAPGQPERKKRDGALKSAENAPPRRAFSQPAGSALRDEYLSFLRSVVPAVSVYADAVDSKDARRIEDARKPLTRLQSQARALDARFASYCHGR